MNHTVLLFLYFSDQSSDEEYEENNIESKDKVNTSDEETNEEDGNEGEESDHENDNNDEVLKSNMSWKENLAQKAREAFLDRHSNTDNLMKLVYGVFSMVS